FAPFARLSFGEKLRAMELLEQKAPQLVAALDGQAPEPFRSVASGLLEFLAGGIFDFTAFGAFGEYGVFNPATRTLTGRPVGWQLTGYQPNGVVDGWNEFKGYYQGRSQAGA